MTNSRDWTSSVSLVSLFAWVLALGAIFAALALLSGCASTVRTFGAPKEGQAQTQPYIRLEASGVNLDNAGLIFAPSGKGALSPVRSSGWVPPDLVPDEPEVVTVAGPVMRNSIRMASPLSPAAGAAETVATLHAWRDRPPAWLTRCAAKGDRRCLAILRLVQEVP